MTAGTIPMALAGLGPTELLIILGVLILLFGAKKLPELARGSGRALRIFKAETKGLVDDDEDDSTKTAEQREIEAHNRAAQARMEDPAPGTTRPHTDSDR